MRYYIGRRIKPEEKTGSDVRIWIRDGEEKKKLTHHVYHSPTGHNWGYNGSGPAELAKDILWDYLGTEPMNSMYQDFKEDEVSRWGDYWRISTEEIGNWINKWHAKEKLLKTGAKLKMILESFVTHETYIEGCETKEGYIPEDCIQKIVDKVLKEEK